MTVCNLIYILRMEHHLASVHANLGELGLFWFLTYSIESILYPSPQQIISDQRTFWFGMPSQICIKNDSCEILSSGTLCFLSSGSH